MDALEYIVTKYGLDPNSRRIPIEIPDTGRDDLAALFGELGFTVGAEIGVECGLYSEVLCRANPNLTLHLIDPWKAYTGYREHVSQDKLDGFYQQTKQRVAPYRCEIVRAFSMDAVKLFEPGSLDFVYIDGNHSLEYAINDIIQWTRRVRVGGIVGGHDYRKNKNPRYLAHVVQAVQAYTDAYSIRPWFVLGRKEVREGEIRDHNRSWLWVKT